jgi:outer membrane protein assembly factor BamD
MGCSGGQRLQHGGPQDAFQQGMTHYDEGDYQEAIRYFRVVLDEYGRGNEWAPQAQFQLAKAQQERGRHLVAANEFQRFTQLYRNNERVPQAEYLRALAYYKRSPMYRLDQSDTRQAISLFQLFIDRYPDHENVSDAEQMIEELRAKLAHKKYAAAQLYEKREMWEATTVTYERVFNQYPETPWADDALLGAVRSYISYADLSIEKKQADRYQKAIEHYQRLTQLFPESPLLSRAEDYYSEAQQKLERVRSREEGEQSLAQEGAGGGAK